MALRPRQPGARAYSRDLGGLALASQARSRFRASARGAGGFGPSVARAGIAAGLAARWRVVAGRRGLGTGAGDRGDPVLRRTEEPHRLPSTPNHQRFRALIGSVEEPDSPSRSASTQSMTRSSRRFRQRSDHLHQRVGSRPQRPRTLRPSKKPFDFAAQIWMYANAHLSAV